jgi:hypothetical protein
MRGAAGTVAIERSGNRLLGHIQRIGQIGHGPDGGLRPVAGANLAQNRLDVNLYRRRTYDEKAFLANPVCTRDYRREDKLDCKSRTSCGHEVAIAAKARRVPMSLRALCARQGPRL